MSAASASTACRSSADCRLGTWWSAWVCSSCATACASGSQASARKPRHVETLEEGPMFDDLPHAHTSRGFNLSRWAIDHGNFTAFLLVMLLAAGGFSLWRIGQKEDPEFTFRTMVVQVLWPGATTEEMQDQVVDKIERKLQETPGLDFVRSYTRPGISNIFVNLK